MNVVVVAHITNTVRYREKLDIFFFLHCAAVFHFSVRPREFSFGLTVDLGERPPEQEEQFFRGRTSPQQTDIKPFTFRFLWLSGSFGIGGSGLTRDFGISPAVRAIKEDYAIREVRIINPSVGVVVIEFRNDCESSAESERVFVSSPLKRPSTPRIFSSPINQGECTFGTVLRSS